jgi:hypothetical protein
MPDYGLDAPSGRELALPPGRRTNRFPGWCVSCKQPVPVGAGTISRDPVTSKWRTQHITCPEQQVQPTVEPQVAALTVTVDMASLAGAIHAVRHNKKTLGPACGCDDLTAKVWAHLGGPK